VSKIDKATAAYYRRRAADSLVGSDKAPTAKSQTAYLELAAIWIELAQRAVLMKEEQCQWLLARAESRHPVH
jgi:hypothetical protein